MIKPETQGGKPDYATLASSAALMSFLAGPLFVFYLSALQFHSLADAPRALLATLIYGIPLGLRGGAFLSLPVILYALFTVKLTHNLAQGLLPNNALGAAIYGAALAFPLHLIISRNPVDSIPVIAAGALAGVLYFRRVSRHSRTPTRLAKANLP